LVVFIAISKAIKDLYDKREGAGKIGEILPAVMKKSTTFKVIGLFTIYNIPEICDGILIKL
jgi:hypothetical protein